ncbi:hypothetical protein IWQ57_000257 [Coemansia nantahalensis]|uniref:Uncharacterized protein n=1 Tax=Coemansia nantahalensis TaxID=2789366 RepID=A0ACC1K8B9_9FUNG|nr:hypothetical protein IWQ57_000257 [Coemansia nantahalensis]
MHGGSGGTAEQVEVVTNFVPVAGVDCKRIHVYLVEVTNQDAQEDGGEGSDQQVREAALRSALFSRAVAGTGAERAVFDGREYAYSAKGLHKEWPGQELQRSVDGGDEAPGRFQVALRVHRRYETGLVARICAGDAAVPEAAAKGLQFALDSVLRVGLRPWLQCVGGRYLSAHAAVATDAGFDIWWEYRLAVHPTRTRMLVSVTARAVPVIASDVRTLDDLWARFFEPGSGAGQGVADAGDRAWAQFEGCVRGLRVAIPGDAAAATSSVRVAGLAPKHADGRCVVVGRDTVVALDQCALAERQVLGQLSRRQRGRLMSQSAVAPARRLELLRHGAQLVARACRDSGALAAFKIRVGDGLATAPGHVLAAPQMQLRGATAAVAADTGRWELGGHQVLDGAHVRSWAVLVLASAQALGEPQARAFAVQLAKTGSEAGVVFAQSVPPIVYGSVQCIERAVEDACAAAQRAAASGERAQLVVCVLPSPAVAVYGEIKRVALTRVGVHTQCVLAANARGHRPQLLRGVALKINTKLGGSTAALHGPAGAPSLLETEPTMVISADVTHTSEAQGMSVAAVVWSVDLHAQRFAGLAIQHPHRMEIIENMDAVVRHCLRIFYARTGRKPARILYYRDGVNDSLLPAVRDVELPAIRRGCALVEPAYAPPLAVLIARKRHHSRFMLDAANCRPGTLVDAMVGPLAGAGGFHLLAHRSVHGVSQPVYYLVLDPGGLDIAQLRQLTYHLCYTYPIYTRPAIMPAPLYYAHRLAARGRLQLSQRFDALPCFATSRAETKKSNRAAKAHPPHLVPVHADLGNSMYFM